MSASPFVPPAGITTVLCDADGTLFPSEEPAFAASVPITEQIAARYGLDGDFSPDAVRRAATGRNFRDATKARLAAAGMRVADTELEEWVQLEKQAVTERLSRVLRPRADVQRAVESLARRYRLAVVSSSATSRLDACFTATGLDEFFPLELRFSAEDSLDPPVSKPDPAVYRHAIRRIGCSPDEALAVEDSVSGVEAAVGAGLRTLGTVEFAPEGERRRLRERLRSAGALAVAGTFAELASWL